MASIGTFTKSDDGFTGTIKTLTLELRAKLVRNPGRDCGDKAPDYRLIAGTFECGAAWKKTSRDGREYLSVKLDDPALPAPIFATLIGADDRETFQLIWSR